MAGSKDDSAILVEYRANGVAIVTLNRPKQLNALGQQEYFDLAVALRDIAERDDIYITVLTGTGRYFSAGANVSIGSSAPTPDESPRQFWLKSFVANNLHITHAFYTHPKILITALNGPAIGLSAALIAFSDFVYATPHTFLLTPFSSLGLVTEGNASVAFVKRLGISKANEALIMSKRITCDELVGTGFVNRVFDVKGEDGQFLEAVLKEVDERLGAHLNRESLLGIKRLIRKPEMDTLDRQGVEEVLAGLERFRKGVPQEEFRKIAAGEKKHKL